MKTLRKIKKFTYLIIESEVYIMNKLKNGFIVVLLGSYALTGLVAATEAYNDSRLQMKVKNFISKIKKS
jgi:hypothetical protein|nr:MAG TPA: hypothetical protein [Caudoviricetes sp.]